MRKNQLNQVVSFQLISTTDGSNVTTGTPAVFVTLDAGTQSTGAGTTTHEGNGQWSYVPTQAETNGDHAAYTIVLAGAVSQTVNVYPVAFNPADSVRMGLTSLPNAAADAAGGLPISDLGGLDMDALNDAAVRLTSARAQVLDDWINAGRLDAILDAIKADTASGGIPKNAAFPGFEFPMVLSSDHYTAATGLTVTGQRSIDGGAFANVTGTISEVGSGVYQGDLSAADTNGDTITYKFSGTAADDSIITVITRS